MATTTWGWLVLLFPLLGTLIIAFGYRRLPGNWAGVIGTAAIGLAFVAALGALISLQGHSSDHRELTSSLWSYANTVGVNAEVSILVDPLSVFMILIVSGISSMIHLYSISYLEEDRGFARYFAYLNFFVFSMLLLVLAGNFLLLIVGWAFVGAASYLLISFWYRRTTATSAGIKAFVINVVGDAGLVLGTYFIFKHTHTLDFQGTFAAAPHVFHTGEADIVAGCLLLLVGAIAKSAQIPLHTWLPDAMEGPTPVSALIHAATMVTAGVYLIARTHGLFELAPYSLEAVGVIGAATLLLASCAALVQSDIKRILAYSTMSQIGYMFLALGSAAWSASIFHLMTHAFFKALLFLTSGAVILACHHEQDIFKMGGLRKQLPLEYACFLVGGLALSAFPVLTAGYYSKDEILWEAYSSGHVGFFLAGLLGALLTPLYTFRLIFTAFHGEAKIQAHRGRGVTYGLPLVVLLMFSTFIGGMIHPPLAGMFPAVREHRTHLTQLEIGTLSSGVALTGIALACGLFLGPRRLVDSLAATLPGGLIARWWLHGWGFDWLYERLLVRPFVGFASANIRDGIDLAILMIPRALRALNEALVRTENGRIRWYAAGMAAGAVLVIAMVLV
jgi:NADH-quinone oxidoreductase subunit L